MRDPTIGFGAWLLFGRHRESVRQEVRFVCQLVARPCLIVRGAEKGGLGNRIARRRLSTTGANEREQGEDNPSIHRSIISREPAWPKPTPQRCSRWTRRGELRATSLSCRRCYRVSRNPNPRGITRRANGRGAGERATQRPPAPSNTTLALARRGWMPTTLHTDQFAPLHAGLRVGHKSLNIHLRMSSIEVAGHTDQSIFLGHIAEGLMAAVRRHMSTSESSLTRRESRPQG